MAGADFVYEIGDAFEDARGLINIVADVFELEEVLVVRGLSLCLEDLVVLVVVAVDVLLVFSSLC